MEFRLNPSKAKWSLALYLLLGLAAEVGTENVILTAYYPAPSGIYTQLITTQKANLARDGGMAIAGADPGLVAGVKMYVSGGDVVVANPSTIQIRDSVGTTQPVFRCTGATRKGLLTTDIAICASLASATGFGIQ